MCGCLADLLPPAAEVKGADMRLKVVEVERNENVGWFLKNNTCKKNTVEELHVCILPFLPVWSEGGESARKHPRSVNDGDVTCRDAFFFFFVLCKQPGGKAANQVSPPCIIRAAR